MPGSCPDLDLATKASLRISCTPIGRARARVASFPPSRSLRAARCPPSPAPPMPEPRYPYVAIDLDPADADEAGALLFELGAQGLEERDETTLVKGATGGAKSATLTLVASRSSSP